ncbi:hypothetical protein MUK42_36985 [Musa troglodytarum]|uniref:Ycf2 N-terminal domain-containing protein n=1 Tax=Musa troglodytarum TaxID=320322 RepID=A0A9E7EDS1_9LILI|nr:hypothetical protein MUK42_36985 [Musa troglodytarum]
MIDLFILSITKLNVMYRRGFTFSIDSHGLDKKNSNNNDR